MKPVTPFAPGSGHFHAVRFFEDGAGLAAIVAGFVAEGLAAGEPALLIMTTEHRANVLRRLAEGGHDPEALRAEGLLWLFDSRETLAEFMVDGLPVWTRFDEAMRCRLRNACGARGNRRVRAYGDMVDLLWQGGTQNAAVRLEMLWNQLAATEDFSLLCGYTIGSFYKTAGFDAVRAQHTHVISDAGEAVSMA